MASAPLFSFRSAWPFHPFQKGRGKPSQVLCLRAEGSAGRLFWQEAPSRYHAMGPLPFFLFYSDHAPYPLYRSTFCSACSSSWPARFPSCWAKVPERVSSQ